MGKRRYSKTGRQWGNRGETRSSPMRSRPPPKPTRRPSVNRPEKNNGDQALPARAQAGRKQLMRYTADQLTPGWRLLISALRDVADGYEDLTEEWETHRGDPDELWEHTAEFLDGMGKALEVLGAEQVRFVRHAKEEDQQIDRQVAAEMGGASEADRRFLAQAGIDFADLPPQTAAASAPETPRGIPWDDRPFRPVHTQAGWIVIGEVPDGVELDAKLRGSLTKAYPTREAAAAAALLLGAAVKTAKNKDG